MSIRSSLVRLATIAAVTAAAAAPAAAQMFPSSGCGGAAGGEYNLCYSVSGLTFGTNSISFTLSNLTDPMYGSTTLSEFIIAGLGSSYTLNSATVGAASAPAISGTSTGSLGFNGQGLTASNYVGFNFNGNNGIADGTSATVTFNFAQTVTQSDFTGSGLQLAMQVQGATAPCASTKAVFTTSGIGTGTVDYSGNNASLACSPGITTTPEPASMALVGGGLLGLVGVGGLRRRAKSIA